MCESCSISPSPMSARYRYHRARAIAEGINPHVPADRAIMPIQTGILPPSRNGAASVTTTPRNAGQVARLQRYLYAKGRQQYQAALQREAAKWGIELSGQITDPAVEQALQERATFAAQSIYNTASRDLASGADAGVSVSDVVAGRDAWKPDQIWKTELGTANNRAIQDFYANHPELNATGHVEPLDAQCAYCQAAVDQGTAPVGDFPELPGHPSCLHEVIADPPKESDTLVAAGTSLSPGPAGMLAGQPETAFDDGFSVIQNVTVGAATAALLRRIEFWVAGMVITNALGDVLHHH